MDTNNMRHAFMAGYEAGFHEGFWCEENPADWEKDGIEEPETHWQGYLVSEEFTVPSLRPTNRTEK